MRVLAVLLTLLVTASATEIRQQLPAPPDGFAWQVIEEIQGALLVPDGWHFHAEQADGTLAYFITETEFDPAEKFLVGVTVNAFLDNPGAPARIEQVLRETAERFGVELREGGFGPFRTLTCRFDLAETPEHPAIRADYLGIVNSRTRTTYLVMFESPVAAWERTSPLGSAILRQLALDGDT